MLEPFSERLASLKEIMKQDSADGKHPEPIVRLMSRKLEGVGKLTEARPEDKAGTDTPERQFTDLQASLSVLSVELVPIHQKIVALRKQLSMMSAEPKFNKTEFRAILEELRKVDQSVCFTSRAASTVTDKVGNG
jgi:chromosome segregation ATPase